MKKLVDFILTKLVNIILLLKQKKHALDGHENFYNEKGKTNKSTTSFEFGNFPIEPIQRYLKEGYIDKSETM